MHRPQVPWVDDRDLQGLTGLADGDAAQFAADIRIDQAGGVWVNPLFAEVDVRQAAAVRSAWEIRP